MEKIKLENIEAINQGTDLRDSLEHWKKGIISMLIWLGVLTMFCFWVFIFKVL